MDEEMRLKIILLTLLIISIVLITPINGEYKFLQEKRGPGVNRIIFKKCEQDLAPKLIERGDLDLYLYNLKIPTAYEYLGSEKLKIYRAPSTMIDILMNPAPAKDGSLNPFSIRGIRKAIQYLIDREYIARSIYRGFAVPMYSHVSPLDFDYIVVARELKRMGITYDPDYAKRLIEQYMEKAGARLIGGKWTYNGKPIKLKFIIRVEDERREIGNMLAEELEKLGFIVERLYMDFAQALSIVYRTDPAALEWHLYTEGWGRTAAERYDYATLNQMCSPWLGNMPGWLEYGFWQYRNETLDILGKRLFRGEYQDLEERNELYRKATKLCLQESIRAWVVTVINVLPARSDLEEVSTDVISGLRSIWTLRSIHTKTGELKVGHLWVRLHTGSAWNPIGGLSDVYSIDIWRQLHDPPIWRDPSTGVPKPFRATYTVETAGPNGWVDVPPDAFIWSAERSSWIKVGEGVKARSKVIFDYSLYLNSKWHHGIKISWEDILYSIYQSFDMTYNSKKAEVEVALSATSKPILETFKGFRIVNGTKLEVYVDYWHPIKDYIAEYAQPWGASMPWELLYAMDILVFEKREAAYTYTASARLGVDWLDLIQPKQARKLVNILNEFIERKQYPGEIFMGYSEGIGAALKRYSAVIEWFKEHGHLIISNGPFYLESMGTITEQYAELKAFRDPSYPFKPSDFYVGQPQSIELSAPRMLSLSRGEDLRLDISVSGPGKIMLKLILFDPTSREILYEMDTGFEGAPVIIPASTFLNLREGIYQLSIIAYSDSVSTVSERVININLSGETVTKTASATPLRTVAEMTTSSTTIQGPPPQSLFIVVMIIAAVALALLLLVRKFKGR
ncbi:MAG: hypothetical protein DRN49_00205 [Thaumarchaeota archaeon]|nr:MAG: hypothetical protein DRN49_00205 [Nitrososphaerota archaeon]